MRGRSLDPYRQKRDSARTPEPFGVAPDPTAVATLGILLLSTDRVAWELMVIPIAWCMVGGATLWAIASPDALLTPLVALIVALLAVRGARV